MYINRSVDHKSYGLYNNCNLITGKINGKFHLKADNNNLTHKIPKNLILTRNKMSEDKNFNLEAGTKLKLRELEISSMYKEPSDRHIASFFDSSNEIYGFMERIVSFSLREVQKLSAETEDEKGSSSLDTFEALGITITDTELRDTLSKDTHENRKKRVENFINHDLRDMLDFAGRFMKLVFSNTNEITGGNLSDILRKYTTQMIEEGKMGEDLTSRRLFSFSSDSLGIDGNLPEGLKYQEVLLKNVLKQIQEKRNILSEIYKRYKIEKPSDKSDSRNKSNPNTEIDADINIGELDYDTVIKMFTHLKNKQKLSFSYGKMRNDVNRLERLI